GLRRALGPAAIACAPAALALVVAAVVFSTTLAVTPDVPSTAAVPPPGVVEPSPAPPETPAIDVVVFGDSVAHTLVGGDVGSIASFPHFEPWRPEQSPADPQRLRMWSVA